MNNEFKQITIKRELAEQLDEIRGKDYSKKWEMRSKSYSWAVEQLLRHKGRLK